MLPEVERLRLVWGRAVWPAARRLGAAALLLSALLASRLARAGTPGARAGAWLLLLGGLGALAGAALWYRRRTGDLRWVLRSIVASVDAELGQKAERALGLWERTERDATAGSSELSRLHLSRQLSRVSIDAVRGAAERRGAWAQRGAFATSLGAVALVFWGLDPLRVVEGFDVMAARGKVAPVELSYLHAMRVEVQPPDYLRMQPRVLVDESKIKAHHGSLLTFRGAPMHRGRSLALTDGVVEVPFVDDGAGRVAARWPLNGRVTLDVVARLGEVRVAQGEPVEVEPIADAAPVVSVEGAPKTFAILELTELPVRYRATDDHGLREVDLVLRWGSREERRVLSRLDGEAQIDEGGHQLRGGDPLLAQAYLPVEVVVEARDNDPLTGPKWGRSQAFLLLPPAIGEPEARRYEALLPVRGAVVDLLAAAVEAPEDRPLDEEFEKRWLTPVSDALAKAASASFGGLGAPPKTKAFAEGQLRKIHAALEAERKGKPRPRRASAVAAVEGAALALDRVLLTLARGDARSVSKRLSRVALDVADQLGRARQGLASADEARQRAEGAMRVLAPSGEALSRLGPLGADLGSIVANDLRRLRRALSADDLRHAELVAYDLGMRLLKANPSFAGGAGGVGEGGGQGQGSAADEAAAGEGQGGDGEEESFDAEQQALQELMRDHAGNIESTQQALRRAADGAVPEATRDEARRHARAVREAVGDLPKDSEAEPAIDQAERSAQALERGELREALDAAKMAEKNLEEQARKAQQSPDAGDQLWGKKLGEAARALSSERRWIEESHQREQQATKQRTDLKEPADQEKRLAERARELARQGDGAQGNMPPQVLERLAQAEQAMRDAARAMAQNNGEESLALQRKAQHLLDGAVTPEPSPQSPPPPGQPESKQDAPPPAQPGDGGRSPGPGPMPIPGADAHQGPREFRRRVSEGLKQGQTPALRDAVRRYAERLLK